MKSRKLSLAVCAVLLFAAFPAFPISIGDKVQATGGNTIRSSAAGSDTGWLTVASRQGTVLAGPTYAYLASTAKWYDWYNVDWDGTSQDGWSIAAAITLVSAPAPSITSVTPASPIGSNSAQPFTINGSGFVSGCNVTLRTGGVTYANRPQSPGGTTTSITINPNFTTTVQSWTVEVINPDGQSSGQFSFDVISGGTASGDLGVRLKKVDGTDAPVEAGTTPHFLLMTTPSQNKYGANPATFANVPAGTYLLEGYHTGTFFGEEFWNSQWCTVVAYSTTPVVLTRAYPYAKSVVMKNVETGETITAGQTVAAGTQVSFEVTVQNDVPSTALDTRVHFLVDLSRDGAYDYESSTAQTISGSGGTKLYTFTGTISGVQTGQFYFALEVMTSTGTRTVRTDSWGWTQAFKIGRISTISGSIDPPSGYTGSTTPTLVSIARYPLGTTVRIDPGSNLRTWIIIHGRKNSSTTPWVPRLAAAITNAYPSDQVLLLDWSEAASDSGVVETLAELWIQPVATWAAGKLKDYGFNGSQLNLIGHSWGTYVANELAERMPSQFVNSIVALDPANDGPGFWLINLPGEIDFAAHSSFSWAFWSRSFEPDTPAWLPPMRYGNPDTAATAAESFIVDGTTHGGVIDIFTDMLEKNNQTNLTLPISGQFKLSRLLAGTRGGPPWRLNQYRALDTPTPTALAYEGYIYSQSGIVPNLLTYVRDSDGQTVSEGTAPALTITSPVDNATVTSPSLTVTGTASDSGLGDNGISSVTVNGVSAVGGTASGANTANWNATITLSPGANTIMVVASDMSNNSIQKEITVTYNSGDTTAPTLMVVSPTNNTTVTSSSLSVSGTASDGGCGDNGVSSVTVNGINATGGTVSGRGTANWSATITLNSGENTITVVASDMSNNSVQKQITVIYNLPGSSPEMDVQGNSISIADGDTTPSTGDYTDFGSALVNGGTVVRIFTIRNTGNGALNLTGSPKVAVSGTHAAEFTVTAQPVTPVSAVSGMTTFQVTFAPAGTGTRSATLSIANDDSNENPYDFTIQGTGATSSRIIGLSGTMAFGNVPVGTSAQSTLTISNTGSSPLTVSGITYPDGFSGSWNGSIAPGGSQNVTVTFTPVAAISYGGTVTMSSDATGGTGTISISGTGTQVTDQPYIISPVPGSMLTSSSATFQWVGGTGVSQYVLYIGRALGGNEIYNQSLGTNLSATVNNLPIDGSTLYIKLWWQPSVGGWQWTNYTYTTFNQTAVLTVSANPSGGGTATGGGVKTNGMAVTVVASANSGYTFVNWAENSSQLSTNSSYTFTITGNRTLTANFTANAQTYNLTVNNGSNGGSYTNGELVAITASNAPAGQTFDRWIGDTQYVASITSATTVVIMPAQEITVTANYTKLPVVAVPGVLAAWDFYGLPMSPSPTTATAAVYTVNSAPVLSRGGGLGRSGMTNTFIAYQFPTNSTLTEAVNANKYFSFSLSNTAPLMVTNVSMCLKRLFATSPTGFTLRVSSDVGFNTYEERNFETGTNTFYVQSAADLNVFGQAVYFRLYGYGDSIGTNNAQAGFAGTTNRVANPENSGLDGTLYDLIVYGYECSEHQDSDSDGIPDSWEQQYFGAPTGANPNTLCSNGINTLRQAYIAGLNPNDPHGAFGISELRSLGMDKVLRWNAVSGRVYSVYWTTNLISGFQCLGSNISWTQGCFTNLTTEPCGYYKIDVRLEE